MGSYNASVGIFITLAVVLGSTSILAVALRLAARRKSHVDLGIDDLFAVISLLATLVYLCLVAWNGENGGGYDPSTLPASVYESWVKSIYIGLCFSPTATAAARFSLLFLYNRIFSPNRGFRIASAIVIVANTIWLLVVTIASILLCVPIEALWNHSIKGRCLNTDAFTIGVEIPEILLDFAVLALPLSLLHRLQMRLSHKLSIAFILALGSFEGVIGCIRIAATWTPQEFNENANNIWLCIQLAVAVYCCCLPTYRSLLPRHAFYQEILNTTRSFLGLSQSSQPQTGSKSPYSSKHSATRAEAGSAKHLRPYQENPNRSFADDRGFVHAGSIEPNVEAPRSAHQAGYMEDAYALDEVTVHKVASVV